jgi:carboxypeptidase family protein/TonB-dependent receptor-like protein
MRFPYVVLLSACALTLALPLLAQSPNGVLNGLVVDPSNQVIVGADIVCVNDVTGVQYAAKTNGEGIYVLPSLPPGPYRLQVSKVGFKTLIKPDIILNVQDALAINFTLPVGALSETVTVEGGAPLVNTESAAVSTVVDRQFAENLPMNGRSFQTLIQLTPGVVLTTSNPSDSGQFSVNGQRASSNYWMVDGVSANIGVGVNLSTSPGNGLSGSLGSFSALGGTNSWVQIDARQTKIKKDWQSEFDRPIYFVDLRDTYMCSWCEVDGNQLVLIPSPQSRRPSKHVRYPGDADVIGRVTVVTMPLAVVR